MVPLFITKAQPKAAPTYLLSVALSSVDWLDAPDYPIRPVRICVLRVRAAPHVLDLAVSMRRQLGPTWGS